MIYVRVYCLWCGTMVPRRIGSTDMKRRMNSFARNWPRFLNGENIPNFKIVFGAFCSLDCKKEFKEGLKL